LSEEFGSGAGGGGAAAPFAVFAAGWPRFDLKLTELKVCASFDLELAKAYEAAAEAQGRCTLGNTIIH